MIARAPRIVSACLLLGSSLACGDDGSGASDSLASAESSSSSDSGTSTSPSTGDGDPSTGDGDPSTGDGDPSTGDGDPSTGDGDPSTGDGDGDTGGIKFDMAPTPDAGGEACMGMGGEVEFSYIWVANTNEGTLSKINTQTLVEEGRYITRPDHAGRPSRTSVNLSGDVVVANRDGGVSKFLARTDACPDQNGVVGIQTSTGKPDVLAWDQEECRAWHTPFAGPSLANRPVAWTAGTLDPQTCAWQDQKVWTQTALLGQPGSMQIHRLDGDTGAIEVSINAPNVALGSWGAYGGAVDGEDNFWFSTHGSANPPTLSRVDYETLTIETWPVPNGVAPYGMTVDSNGYAWVAGYAGGVARFTPETETWDVIPTVTGLGMQADSEGRVWVGSYGGMGTGVAAIDAQTLELLDFIAMPNAGVTKGISVDFFGYVWVVNMGANAYRVDPDTHQWESYDGLNSAYTYSDMTGAGLKSVAFPQG